MREIARHAGVGPATLYRRFPTKRALIDEAFADEMRACRRIVVDGHAEPDPWHGFCSVIEGITETISQVNEISSAIAASVEEQASVTQSISSNMQVAAKGVSEIDGSMREIAEATRSVDDATRKVKEASRKLA